MRRGVVKKGFPGTRMLGHEGLDVSMDADGSGPSFRPGGVNPRDVTEADRIKDRRGGCSIRTGLESPALQSSKCAAVCLRRGKGATVVRLLSSGPNGVNPNDKMIPNNCMIQNVLDYHPSPPTERKTVGELVDITLGHICEQKFGKF